MKSVRKTNDQEMECIKNKDEKKEKKKERKINQRVKIKWYVEERETKHVKEEFSMGIKVAMQWSLIKVKVNHLNMSEYIFQHQYSYMVNYKLQFQEWHQEKVWRLITNEDGEDVVYKIFFRNV